MLCFGLQPFLHSQAPERAFQMLSALQRHRHMIGRAAGLSHALSSLAAAATPALATHTVSYTPLHSSVAHAAVAASTRSFSAASSAPQQQRSHRPRNPSDNPSKPSPNRNASPAAAGQPSKVSGVYEFTSKYRPRFGKRASPRVCVQLDDVLTRFLDTAEVPTADAITFEPIACPPEFDAPIARLAPGLQSVVTSGSVSTTSPIDSLQKVDFPAHIYQPEEIRWDLIPPFITASRDPVLLSLVANSGGRFFGSTSSCSPILSQVAFALTSFMPVQVPQLSQWFAYMPRSHTRAAVKPSCNILRRRRPEFLAAAGVLASGSAPANAAAPEANEAGDAVSPEATAAIASRDGSLWGIDNYPVGSPKRNQVLIDLGKSLERQLTMDPEEFARTMVIPRDADGNLIHPTEEELEAAAKAQAGADLREAYRFVKAGELVLRSQLDCYDEGVDGPKKVFDLKTRAVLPIRLDVENHSDYLSYSIERKEGVYSSFEREWYDMARAAFLKYSFQCRIGDMGGIFVGYHNTARLFGFQYISLDEMDTALYGSPALAQAIYEQCVRLLELSLHRIVDDCAESAGVSHDAIRVTVRAFSNRFEVFTETLPPLPAPGTRTSKDIEAALLDIHCGAMRVDSLTDDEVREALATRNAKTTGTRAELSARLEDLVAAADGVYTVPPIDYLVARVNTDNVRMYTVGLDVLVNGAPRVALNTFKDGDKLHSLFQFKRVTDHAPEEVAHAYAEALTEWLLREEDRPEDTAKASDVQAQLAAVAAATGRSLSNAHSADSASAVGAGAETLGNVVSTETSRDRDGNNMTTTRFEDRTSAVVVTDAEGRVLRASHLDADGAEISVEAPPVPLEVRKSGRRLQAERILRERERLEKFFEGEKGGMSPDMLLTMQRKRAIEQTSRRRTSRKVM